MDCERTQTHRLGMRLPIKLLIGNGREYFSGILHFGVELRYQRLRYRHAPESISPEKNSPPLMNLRGNLGEIEVSDPIYCFL